MRRDKHCRSNEQILSYFSPFVSHFDDPPQNKIKQNQSMSDSDRDISAARDEFAGVAA
jgi:hypothetical protein